MSSSENKKCAELLRTTSLKTWFPVTGGLFLRVKGHVRAVDDVSIHISKGETFGLVGESGSGKTTFGRSILRLVEPTGGRVFFEGEDILNLNPQEMRKKRKDMQIIFQDPYGALHPRMRIGDFIGEPLRVIDGETKAAIRNRVSELLDIVGLKAEQASRYPHEFSGGQRQRIMIARALSLNPKFIVCDEPVSALDVSIQSQILNLLKDLQSEFDLTYLFISHDLSVVEYICDKIAVMYLGKIVELAPKDELFNNPHHPYTQALLSSIPSIDPEEKKETQVLKGDIPSPINPPEGCRFHTRCNFAQEFCKSEPAMRTVGNDHLVACHLYEEGMGQDNKNRREHYVPREIPVS